MGDSDTPYGFSESFNKALAEASKNWSEQLTSIAKQFSSIATAQAAIGQRFAESLRPFHDAIQRSLSKIDFSWFQEAWQHAMPPNWRELEWPDVDRVLAVMDETGWCLVWCPRTDIIRDLMDAVDADTRAQILLASKGAVLEDMNDCLAGMNHPESSHYRRAGHCCIGHRRLHQGDSRDEITPASSCPTSAQVSLLRVPVPARGHHPCGPLVPAVRPLLPRRGRAPGRTRGSRSIT